MSTAIEQQTLVRSAADPVGEIRRALQEARIPGCDVVDTIDANGTMDPKLRL